MKRISACSSAARRGLAPLVALVPGLAIGLTLQGCVGGLIATGARVTGMASAQGNSSGTFTVVPVLNDGAGMAGGTSAPNAPFGPLLSAAATAGVTASGSLAAGVPVPAPLAGTAATTQTSAVAPGMLALYSTTAGPIVADPYGTFRYAGQGTFMALGPAFPEGSPPTAIATTASGSLFAAGQSGIYSLAASQWTQVASASGVADLALAPDSSFGLAVQDDGGVWTFSGSTWSQLASLGVPLGGVVVKSATESYVVGQGLFDRWDGQRFAPLAPPPSAQPVAGLALDASGSLYVTTRTALFKQTPTGWAQAGPTSEAAALGIPSFLSSAGVVGEIGDASPSVYTFDGRTWTPIASPLPAVDTLAAWTAQDALAMAADGSSLGIWENGSWSTLPVPGQ